MENTLGPDTVLPNDRRIIVAPEALAAVAADRIALLIEQAVTRHGRATVALSGGATPRAVYRRLALHHLPWEKVEIYFGDERAVLPGDPESNYRMARETLLDAVPIPPIHVHRMPAERPDRDAAAAEYAAQLPEQFDLIVLGIGEDGHTASLFPGSTVLGETRHQVVAVTGPKAPHQRLTMTPPVIASALTVMVLASGSAKAKAVAQALEGPGRPVDCPAQLARQGIWILDHAAASGLRRKPST
ncbi:MAG: 6-phosphogluconolactonase [Sulfuricaulis sp.]|nr:6-phosphogluconolactonase [Sulfuricaulis sp.]